MDHIHGKPKTKKLLKCRREICVFWVRQRFLSYNAKSTIYKRTNKLALIQISNPCCKDTVKRMNKLQENTFNSHT